MKRILLALGNFAALWGLLLAITLFAAFPTGKVDEWFWAIFLLSACVAALAELLLFRQYPSRLARYLSRLVRYLFRLSIHVHPLRIFLGILTGAGVMAILYVISSGLSYYGPSSRAVLASTFVLLLLPALFWRLRLPKLEILLTMIVWLCAVGTVYGLACYQKMLVRKTAEKWKAKGWRMEFRENVNRPVTEPECKRWFDELSSFPYEKFQEFFSSTRSAYSDIEEALMKGEYPGLPLARREIAENAGWTSFLAVNSEIVRAMKACPCARLLTPIEAGNNWTATREERLTVNKQFPLPYRYGCVMDWGRAIMVWAMVQGEKGNLEEAKTLWKILEQSAEKVVQGDQDCGGCADLGRLWDENAVLTCACLQAITAQPFDSSEGRPVLDRATCIQSCPLSVFESMRLNEYALCQRAGFDQERLNFPSPIPGPLYWHLVLHWESFRSIFNLPRTRHVLPALTDWTEWLRTVPDLSRGRFAWHEARSRFDVSEPRAGSEGTSKSCLRIYARHLTQVAQWRLLLAIDSVLRYRQEHQALPNDPRETDPSWPIDPFDEKPIRYRKTGDKSFIVYSVGPDEKDQGGGNLSDSDFLFESRVRDIGFHIALK